MIKDVLIHYMYLLGVNPNEHAVDIPSNYENRWLDDLGFIPPPAHFILPDWATPCQPGDNDTEEERSSYFVRSSARPSNAEEFLSSSSSMTSPSQTPPPASPIRKPKATKGRQRPRSPSSSPSPSPQPRSRAARLRDEPPASPPPPPTYPSSPPPPPSKRKRAASPASSTLRDEYNLENTRPRIILRLSKNQLQSKPPKKQPRQSSTNKTLGSLCYSCNEKVDIMDIKSKNTLVRCSDHLVHKYCMQTCLQRHSN